MTGRTHDLAAFTALNYIVVTNPISQMSLPTVLVAFGANMIGGLAPDLDQTTSKIWNSVPAGSVFGRLITPLLGGHRFISHSILGIFLFGYVANIILGKLGSILLVDMVPVWWAFMIGFISHLVMDTLTRDGVPWLFPIPIRFGIPPLRFFRIRTGGLLEKTFIFPVLLIANVYLLYTFYPKYLDFLHYYIK